VNSMNVHEIGLKAGIRPSEAFLRENVK
jgi:hypothetical protein